MECILHALVSPSFLPRFDLASFRSLTLLCLDGVPCAALLTSLGPLRSTLRRLRARGCRLGSVADILLSDSGRREGLAALTLLLEEEGGTDDAKLVWERLERLDLSGNQIEEIDRSVSSAGCSGKK